MDKTSSIYNSLRADGSLKKGILNESFLTVLRQFMETGFSAIEINCKPEIKEEVSHYLFTDFGEEWDYTNKYYEADDFVSTFEDEDLLEEEEDPEEGLDVVDFFEKYSDYEYEENKNPLSISMLTNGGILVEVDNLSIMHGYDVIMCEPRDGAECLKKSLERTKEKYPEISYFGYIAYDWSDEKGGDIEEYTLTANFNPDKEVHLKSYKSLEGTCSIEQSGREYTLVPKELKITMADGHKYYIKYGFNNSIRAYKPLDGGNDKNVQVIIDELKQQNVFKELINV